MKNWVDDAHGHKRDSEVMVFSSLVLNEPKHTWKQFIFIVCSQLSNTQSSVFLSISFTRNFTQLCLIIFHAYKIGYKSGQLKLHSVEVDFKVGCLTLWKVWIMLSNLFTWCYISSFSVHWYKRRSKLSDHWSRWVAVTFDPTIMVHIMSA